MFCANCGTTIADGVANCPCCGASISSEGPQPRYSTARTAPEAPASSFSAPTSVDGNGQMPAGGAAPSYNAPPSAYGAPANPYGAPANPYGTPATPYGAPMDPYGAPPPSYGGGIPTYGAPTGPYAPQPPYAGPEVSYGGPMPGASYGGSMYGEAPAPSAPDEPAMGLAIPGFILGIVTAFLSFFTWLAFFTAPGAIVMSIIAKNQGNTTKFPQFGLILGIVGAANCTLFQFIFFALENF